MAMRDPPHPGRVVRQECLEPLGLSVTAGAKALGVTRQTLYRHLSPQGELRPDGVRLLARA